MRKVAFIQISCPSYKIPMFKEIARQPNIELSMFVGDKSLPTVPKNGDLNELDHTLIKNKFVRVLMLIFVFQTFSKSFRVTDYDFVILPDGLSFLSNYFILAKCKLHGVSVGFYSHGFNHQRASSFLGRVAELVRSTVHRIGDFVVVYSDRGYDHVRQVSGVRAENVFVARNSLDVTGILKRSAVLSDHDVSSFRTDLGIQPSDFLLGFTGRLAAEKKPVWVIQAVEELTKRGVPSGAIFVGDGPEATALHNKWLSLPAKLQDKIHFLGRKEFEELDLALKSVDVSVMPGMTGLALVHSFVLAKPFVTVNVKDHSPEIDYLRDGINGLIVENDLEAFCDALVSLYNDPCKREQIGEAGYRYSIENLTNEKQIEGFCELFNTLA